MYAQALEAESPSERRCQGRRKRSLHTGSGACVPGIRAIPQRLLAHKVGRNRKVDAAIWTWGREVLRRRAEERVVASHQRQAVGRASRVDAPCISESSSAQTLSTRRPAKRRQRFWPASTNRSTSGSAVRTPTTRDWTASRAAEKQNWRHGEEVGQANKGGEGW